MVEWVKIARNFDKQKLCEDHPNHAASLGITDNLIAQPDVSTACACSSAELQFSCDADLNSTIEELAAQQDVQNIAQDQDIAIAQSNGAIDIKDVDEPHVPCVTAPCQQAGTCVFWKQRLAQLLQQGCCNNHKSIAYATWAVA